MQFEQSLAEVRSVIDLTDEEVAEMKDALLSLAAQAPRVSWDPWWIIPFAQGWVAAKRKEER